MRNLARKRWKLSDGDTGVNGGGAEVAQSKKSITGANIVRVSDTG